MKQNWNDTELGKQWALLLDEMDMLKHKPGPSRLGFALLLKYFLIEGRFPESRRDVPRGAVDFVAAQTGVPPKSFNSYRLLSRTAKRHRVAIRLHAGFRRPKETDGQAALKWLVEHALPTDQDEKQAEQSLLNWYRQRKIEAPRVDARRRILRSAFQQQEAAFCRFIANRLSRASRNSLDALLAETPRLQTDPAPEDFEILVPQLKVDPGRPSLKTALREISKLDTMAGLEMPENLFVSVSLAVLDKYKNRVIAERMTELRRHDDASRYTLLAAFCWRRRQEITDGLVDLLVQIVHRISVRAERKINKRILKEVRKVHGKTTLLYKVADAAVASPDGVVREVVFPVVPEGTLKELVAEHKTMGSAYEREVYSVIRASYGNHYRQMLPPILNALESCSNNNTHRPVIDALEFLKSEEGNSGRFFDVDDVPIDGVVQSKWKTLVVEEAPRGGDRVNRINYEICVLQALRMRLRCKENWVTGADRYRNPDQDLPGDFEKNREHYYSQLRQPVAADDFIAKLQDQMKEELARLDAELPANPKVRLLERPGKRIVVTPLDAEPEPMNLPLLRAQLSRLWPMTSLLDVLKEADLRSGFTDMFKTVATRQELDPTDLQQRQSLPDSRGSRRLPCVVPVAISRPVRMLWMATTTKSGASSRSLPASSRLLATPSRISSCRPQQGRVAPGNLTPRLSQNRA